MATQQDEPLTVDPPGRVPHGRDRTKALEMMDKICQWAHLTGFKQHFGLNQIAVANTLGRQLPSGGGSDSSPGEEGGGSMDLGSLNELIRNLDPAPFGTQVFVVDNSQGKPQSGPQQPVATEPTPPPVPPAAPAAQSGLSTMAKAGLLAAAVASGGGLVGLGSWLGRHPTPSPEPPAQVEPIELQGTMKWESRDESSVSTGVSTGN